MANEIVFAIEHVLTTEGWFLPGHLLPKHDLDDAEGMKLMEERKIGVCAYDSPLAKAVHDARAMDPYAGSQYLKRVIDVDQLSPHSPDVEPRDTERPEPGDDWVDPTPVGEFPTLENFVRAGYSAENYEGQKEEWNKNRTAGTNVAQNESPKGEEPKGEEPKGEAASEPNSDAPTE